MTLLPAIQHRDQLLHHLRPKDPSEDSTAIKVELRAVLNVVSDHVSLAKAAWSTHQATINYNIRFIPKDAWASVKVLAGGMTSHHKKTTVMQIKLTNGELAKTDAGNASVMGPHLENVYRNHPPVYWTVLNKLPQQYLMPGLDTLISWEEFKQAITKLSNGKSPGLNDVPPDAFKALDDQNLLTLMNFFNSYWIEESKFIEWHEGQLLPVPKSGDRSDPNKWRGVTLMYIGSKIFSSILCTRLFKTIIKHGVKYQFGSTPGVGCQDGSFTIKKCCTCSTIRTYPHL